MDLTLTSGESDIDFSLIASRNMTVITVSENAMLTINGIGVTGRYGRLGVQNQGTFILNGGEISRNNSTHSSLVEGSGRGGGVMNNGVFLMNGGIITDNTSTMTSTGHVFRAIGGGVHNSGTFTMNGGLIYNNSAHDIGGGVSNLGTFILSDGIISNNSLRANVGAGGGVHNQGDFTMSGGSIKGNSARIGAGIQNAEGTITMLGGGVNHPTGGNFTFEGEWIYDNEAPTGADINIGGNAPFHNNVFDINIGAIGNPPPQ